MSTHPQASGAASRRLTHGLAVLLVAGSGTLMLAAGHALARQGGWASSRPLAIGGGIAIQVAFLMERHQVQRGARPPRSPGQAWPRQILASGLVGMSGVGLVMVGRSALAQGWWPIGTYIVPLIVLVVIAAALNADAAAIRAQARRSRTALVALDVCDGAGDRHAASAEPARPTSSPSLPGHVRRHPIGVFLAALTGEPR